MISFLNTLKTENNQLKKEINNLKKSSNLGNKNKTKIVDCINNHTKLNNSYYTHLTNRSYKTNSLNKIINSPENIKFKRTISTMNHNKPIVRLINDISQNNCNTNNISCLSNNAHFNNLQVTKVNYFSLCNAFCNDNSQSLINEELDYLDSIESLVLQIKSKYNLLYNNNTSIINHDYNNDYIIEFKHKI